MSIRKSHDTMEISPSPQPGQHLANPVSHQKLQAVEKHSASQHKAPSNAPKAPLAMGGFATTLLSVSLAMMNFRGVSTQTIFVGDLCFVACIGLLISAQWEMVRGNTFSYTVLSAYALFYGGYGATMVPAFGIIDAYGGFTSEYYNALGFFVLLWGVFNFFFLIASIRFNVVYILIFATLELCLIFDAASQFTRADGKIALSESFSTVGGAFAFISSILGYYTVLHYLCQESLPISVVMGDTSRFFVKPQAAGSCVRVSSKKTDHIV